MSTGSQQLPTRSFISSLSSSNKHTQFFGGDSKTLSTKRSSIDTNFNLSSSQSQSSFDYTTLNNNHNHNCSNNYDIPSFSHYLKSRSLDSSSFTKFNLNQFTRKRLPNALFEVVIPTPELDKVFASLWLDDEHVLIGTKCNRIILINVRSNRIVEIPFQSIITINDTSQIHLTIHHQKIKDVSPLYRTAPLTLFRRDSGIETDTLIPLQSQMKCTGIHSMVMNSTRTQIAVGGSGQKYQVVLYSVPELVPVCLLEGHTDLVFSVAYVSDDILVTASRDTTMCIYALNRSEPEKYVTYLDKNIPVLKPISIDNTHKSKIRDLKFHTQFQNLVSLSVDGSVRIFDVNRFQLICKPNLPYRKETCCLGLDPSDVLISIGSQAHISLYDLRDSAFHRTTMDQTCDFCSLDDGWGVRSLAHCHNIITCGGGMGRIGFYDTRASQYLPVTNTGVYKEASILFSGNLTLHHRHSESHVDNGLIPSAIYTLSYSSNGTRLFSGGGPLQLGIRGSYCAVW